MNGVIKPESLRPARTVETSSSTVPQVFCEFKDLLGVPTLYDVGFGRVRLTKSLLSNVLHS